MHPSLLDLVRCLRCGGRFDVVSPVSEAGAIRAGTIRCGACGESHAIRDQVLRIRPPDPNDVHFGQQWRRFARTQLDSHTGQPISRDRFLRFTGWTGQDLAGRVVLDVGCGAGRFAEVALALGARVVAVDSSLAVDACQASLGRHPRLDVVQADLHALPFVPAGFDFVYCLGVLQHTPDPRAAFLRLPPLVAAGGRIAVDVYPRLRRNLLWSKYWLRPLSRRLAPRRLFALVSACFPPLYALSRILGRLPGPARKLRYLVPVANYEGVYPLSREQLREWALLDTLDMLGPRYDKPQSAAALRSWCQEAGLAEISVERIGFLVARGRRPATADA